MVSSTYTRTRATNVDTRARSAKLVRCIARRGHRIATSLVASCGKAGIVVGKLCCQWSGRLVIRVERAVWIIPSISTTLEDGRVNAWSTCYPWVSKDALDGDERKNCESFQRHSVAWMCGDDAFALCQAGRSNLYRSCRASDILMPAIFVWQDTSCLGIILSCTGLAGESRCQKHEVDHAQH